jgi:hypothetical protein
MGRQMLRCAQHDRTGFDWEKSLSGPDWPIMNMNKESATEEILRFPFASLRASCMDYHHHHLVYHHRNMMVEAPLNGLEAVDTM